MSEEQFFAQSIILWMRRLEGFAQLHGGGKAARDRVDPMTRAELEDLMDEYPDVPGPAMPPPQSKPEPMPAL